MNDFEPNIQPDMLEVLKKQSRSSKKYYKCINKMCEKEMPNPFRWVNGASTKLACPYCENPVIEI